MSTKILDISSLKIHLPVLADEASLKRQFPEQVAGNLDDLDKAYALLSPPTSQPVDIKMVLVENESLVGSSSHEIITASSDALRIPLESFVKPSLAQIGNLASLFQDEKDVQRAVPVLEKERSVCLVWTRSSWPDGKRPVFRFHEFTPIHGVLWVMLPILAR